jgi:hypothetical protein
MTDCILRFDGWYDNFPDLIRSPKIFALPFSLFEKKTSKICRGHLDFNEQEKKECIEPQRRKIYFWVNFTHL